MSEALYLDYNATHPPFSNEILKAQEFYFTYFANSSGRNAFSQRTAALLEQQRRDLLNLLQTPTAQLIFTSSATEANCLAIRAVCEQISVTRLAKVLVSHFEHPSVLETLKALQAEKKIQVDYLPMTSSFQNHVEYNETPIESQMGLIATTELLSQNEFDLIICMHCHNESGLTLPVKQLLAILKSQSFDKYFLCDASQALAKWNSENVAKEFANLISDSGSIRLLFSFAGHKIGAGFGVGLLLASANVDLKALSKFPLFFGGSQEMELRPSSHNLAAIVAFSLVVKKRFEDPGLLAKISKYSLDFETQLQQVIHENEFLVTIVANQQRRYPGTTLLLLQNTQIDFLLMALDKAEIYLSTGTSCKSKSRVPSKGLLALGYDEKQAISVLRISYGANFNPEKQIYFLNKITNLLPLCRE